MLMLSTFGMDIRPFLVPGPHCIYPVHPYGPLGITDQTVYLPNGDIQVIYLNMDFSLKNGQLSCQWFDKASLYDFACVYTHAQSNLASNCLKGIMTSQVRAVVLASYGNASLKVGLSMLVRKFKKVGFKISSEEIAKIAKHYKQALPISFWWQHLGCRHPCYPICPDYHRSFWQVDSKRWLGMGGHSIKSIHFLLKAHKQYEFLRLKWKCNGYNPRLLKIN